MLPLGWPQGWFGLLNTAAAGFLMLAGYHFIGLLVGVGLLAVAWLGLGMTWLH